MQYGGIGHEILKLIVETDENGRPETTQYGSNAKEVFDKLVKRNVAIEVFCTAIKEMHIVSLIVAVGKIEVANIDKVKITATPRGVETYLNLEYSRMMYAK